MAMTSRCIAAIAALTAGIAAAAPIAHADPIDAVFYNLAPTSTDSLTNDDGTDAIGSYGTLAQSFNGGSQAEPLDSVALLLVNGSTANLGGSIQVSLLADNSNTPGTALISLGSLPDSAVGTTGSAYVFTPATSYQLQPYTQYWIEVTAPTQDTLQWGYSLDTTALGVGGQYAYDALDGVNPVAGWGAYQMDVEVPEPGTLALVLSGLGALGFRRRRRS